MERHHCDLSAGPVHVGGGLGEFKVQAYVYKDGKVFWALDNFLTVFHAKRRSIRIASQAAKERAILKEACGVVGLDFDAVFQASMHQCKVGEYEANVYTRTFQSITTKAALVLLLWWAKASWKHDQKVVGHQMLLQFVQRCAKCDWSMAASPRSSWKAQWSCATQRSAMLDHTCAWFRC